MPVVVLKFLTNVECNVSRFSDDFAKMLMTGKGEGSFTSIVTKLFLDDIL